MANTQTIKLEDLGVIVTEDIRNTFANIEVEAGILQEQLYKNGASLQQVAGELQSRYGWIDKGIRTGENSDLKVAIDIVVKGLAEGKFTEQQFVNAVKACFVNPINRREFGSNSPLTIKIKGFDKVMVDTGRFIKAINARLTRRPGNVS